MFHDANVITKLYSNESNYDHLFPGNIKRALISATRSDYSQLQQSRKK
jgi:hypothetical protein